MHFCSCEISCSIIGFYTHLATTALLSLIQLDPIGGGSRFSTGSNSQPKFIVALVAGIDTQLENSVAKDWYCYIPAILCKLLISGLVCVIFCTRSSSEFPINGLLPEEKEISTVCIGATLTTSKQGIDS